MCGKHKARGHESKHGKKQGTEGGISWEKDLAKATRTVVKNAIAKKNGGDVEKESDGGGDEPTYTKNHEKLRSHAPEEVKNCLCDLNQEGWIHNN